MREITKKDYIIGGIKLALIILGFLLVILSIYALEQAFKTVVIIMTLKFLNIL